MPRTRDSGRTTRLLLIAATAEFSEHGFEEAKTERIVAAAGVTRGALYHHFADKRALFAAVVDELQLDIEMAVQSAAKGQTSPYAALRDGLMAYLDCCVRPDVRRIVLIDGPSVLGWEHWREIDERHGLDATHQAVRSSLASGELIGADAESTARVLLGMIIQAGLEIGRAPEPEVTRRELGDAIDEILDRLSSGPAPYAS